MVTMGVIEECGKGNDFVFCFVTARTLEVFGTNKFTKQMVGTLLE